MLQGNHTGMKTGEVAIVGMCGRFPGARNVDEFWRIFATASNPSSRSLRKS